VTAADFCGLYVLQPLVRSSRVPAYLVIMSRDPHTILRNAVGYAVSIRPSHGY